MTKLRLHKLRAKNFFELVGTKVPDTVSVSFDMQENQPLPKLSVGEVYYSRQIWMFNLTFVIHGPNQGKENVFIYTWTENQSARGSNQVCSALMDFIKVLENRFQGDPQKPSKLRLFSDACSGQNKNRTLVGSLLHYVNQTNKSPFFSTIEHFFPIRGHSYMPPDWVFGRMEQEFRKKEVIESPREYLEIYKKYGVGKMLGEEWNVLNYKLCATNSLK